jgi:hypothetical protein
MNVVLDDNVNYLYESYWSEYGDKKDLGGKEFPSVFKAIPFKKSDEFVKKLEDVEKISKVVDVASRKCLLCSHVDNKIYNLNNIKWESMLKHYVVVHKIKPSNEFIEYVFRYDLGSDMKRTRGRKKKKNYLKINKNQMNILDALMNHGGSQYYQDKTDAKVFRYSEHAGLLHFDNQKLSKIIVFTNTNRVDEYDTDIYLPGENEETLNYEFFYHTHPPTPTPGGRYDAGILYEFPSMSDIFHYIDHNNYGKAKGSIIVTAEGLYIIRKYDRSKKKIKINEDELFQRYSKLLDKCQMEAIDKYVPFDSKKFYKVIAQDKSYIGRINYLLRQYNLWVDFYNRVKDGKGNWFIDTIKLELM